MTVGDTAVALPHPGVSTCERRDAGSTIATGWPVGLRARANGGRWGGWIPP